MYMIHIYKYIYTNTYVVYICAESRHNSESPANYGLLSATHVDHTYEFVTLSYVSQNVFSQQVRKVVTVSRHPQTMAPCQRLHHHALCSRYLLSHAGIYTNIYIYQVYMYITIDTYIAGYIYRHDRVRHTRIIEVCIYAFVYLPQPVCLYVSSSIAMFTFSRTYLYKNICILGIYVHSYRYIYREIYIYTL